MTFQSHPSHADFVDYRRVLLDAQADVPSIDQRLAAVVRWDAFDALAAHYQHHPPLFPILRLGWDMFRIWGEEAAEEYALLAMENDGVPRTEAARDWTSFDRARQPSDRLLIDECDEAMAVGSAMPAYLSITVERLRDVLDVNRKARVAAAEVEWQARSDAAHADWVRETNLIGAGGLPLLDGQRIVVELGQPILEGFNAGHSGQPATDAPCLPEPMRGHPLFDAVNLAIRNMTALGARDRGRLNAGAVVDALAVVSAVHEDTFRAAVTQLRATGVIVSEGRLATATFRFETAVTREMRSGSGWRTNLKGDPDPQDADNVAVLLRFVGASLRFNNWHQRIEIKATADEEWIPFTDAELNRLRSIASSEEHRFRPTKDFMRDMLADIARQTTVDPVLDWIDSAPWDGQPRLATWLSRTCGVPPDAYHAAIGKNIIGGLVRRARHPGCKHDEVAIFIGRQGCGKSNLTKVLALRSEWHTDSVAFEGRPQDIVPQLFGKTVVELSELDGVHRREAGYIKRFLSTQSDSVTLKYEAFAGNYPRRCIFIGTCNLENPLVDDTGNRRFFPVRIPKDVDIAWLEANIKQLIGEAAALESAGESFGIPRDVWAAASALQEGARARPDFELMLEDWFAKDQGDAFVTAADLTRLVRSSVGRVAPQAVGAAMRRLGFESITPRVAGTTAKAWCRGGMAGARQYVPRHSAEGFVTVALRPNSYLHSHGDIGDKDQ
jgi:hypothetical protein